MGNLSIGINDYKGTTIHKAFADDDLIKGKALPDGTVRVWSGITYIKKGKEWLTEKQHMAHHTPLFDVIKASPEGAIHIEWGNDPEGVEVGTVNTIKGTSGIKVAPGQWKTMAEYIKSWKMKPPTSKESKQNWQKIVAKRKQDKMIQRQADEVAMKAKKVPKSSDIKKLEQVPLDDGQSSRYLSTVVAGWDQNTMDQCLTNEKTKYKLGSWMREMGDKTDEYDIKNAGSSIRSASHHEPFKGQKADFTSCTSGQMSLISAYSNSAYHAVNRYATGKIIVKDEALNNCMKLLVDTMDIGIRNIKNNDKYEKCHRAYNPQSSGGKTAEEKMTDHMVGYMQKMGRETQFGTVTSTSSSPGSAFTPKQHAIAYVITNPTGGKMISDISAHPHEDELVFPPSSKFTVKEAIRTVDTEYNEKYGMSSRNFVHLEEIA